MANVITNGDIGRGIRPQYLPGSSGGNGAGDCARPVADIPVAEYGLLTDAREFDAAIAPAIRQARRRVFIQVMTFELDGIGRRFWEMLVQSPAAEKVLCVDAFSRAKISDDLTLGRRYLTDAAFRREARATRRLLRNGTQDGVRIVVTNPLGAFWWRYPHRNHKKLMVVDDCAFLGGINFSEHNFAWGDLMLRTDSPPLVAALAQDFAATIAGVNQSAVRELPGGNRLYLLDGRRSRAEFAALFDEITAARQSIDIISPYLSGPLLERLAAVSASIPVRIITPADNNKPVMQQGLFRAAGTAGANLEILLHGPGMSHLKAALIDDSRLLLGSYNFDLLGCELQQEVMLSGGDAGLVAEFRRRILSPLLASAVPAAEAPPARFYHRSGVWTYLLRQYFRLLGRLDG